MYVTPHFIWHPGPAAQPGAALCCAVLTLEVEHQQQALPQERQAQEGLRGAPGRQLNYEPPCQKLQACRWCKAERLDRKCG